MATKFKRGTTWYIKYKSSSGEWKNISCGSTATATEAEVLRQKYDSMAFNNRHKTAIRSVETDIIDQLAVYRDTQIQLSTTGRPKGRKTVQRNKALINNLINFCENENLRSYEDLTTEKMRLFFNNVLEFGGRKRPGTEECKGAPATVRKHRQEFNQFFKWSISQHFCESNPVETIKNPKREKKIPRFFSERELKKIFDSAPQPYLNVFRFLYLTGMRIGEIGNAEWSHYLEHMQTLRIPVMEGNKTKHEESIPLNKSALKIIDEQKETTFDQPYIFLNALHGKLDNGNIYEHLKKVLKKCGISNASPHTFRHTCASHLVIKGVSLYIVRDILRHASIKETECYAHLSREATRAAIEQLII